MNPALTDLKPGIMYLGFGKPDLRKQDEWGAKILVAFVKCRGKFHGMRVVVQKNPQLDFEELLNYYVEKMRTHFEDTYFPKKVMGIPIEKMEYAVELEDFNLAKNANRISNPFAIS